MFETDATSRQLSISRVLGTILLPALLSAEIVLSPLFGPMLELEIPTPAVFVEPVHIVLPPMPLAEKRQTPETAPNRGPVADAAQFSLSKDGEVASPGTARWRALAADGRRRTFSIVALDSYEMLKQNNIPISFDVSPPFSDTLVLMPQSGLLTPTLVPDGTIPRELLFLTTPPEQVEAGRALGKRKFGGPVRVFAHYPAHTYHVLRSLAAEQLKQRAMDPDRVSEVHVRIRAVGGSAFRVEFIKAFCGGSSS